MSEVPRQLGSLIVERQIGQGGMGVVYLACDSKLDRLVAVKCLPAGWETNSERLARFQREAKLLAALNHPHIASIYGLENHEDQTYLVMEYVEGATLSDRIKDRRLTIEEVLEFARQTASAVEAAHEQGIVHRDLKPTNIKLTRDQQVKVLDFGLATHLAPDDLLDGDLVDDKSTAEYKSLMSLPGVVLGTPGYLSPEQARGEAVDRRADIFSFGCVLYQMLTNQTAFSLKGSIEESISAVLHHEPDFGLIEESVPYEVRTLVQRCLVKNRNRRLQAIGDARIVLEETLEEGLSRQSEPPQFARSIFRQSRYWPIVGSLLAGVAILLWGTTWFLGGFENPRREPALSLHLSIVEQLDISNPTGGVTGPTLAISHDGLQVTFLGAEDGDSFLYLRDLTTGKTRRVPGSSGASTPFFSPDDQQLGFISKGKLWVIWLEGSTPHVVCDVPTTRGVCWLDNLRIVIARINPGGMVTVDAHTGQVESLTEIDADSGVTSHRHPEKITGTNRILFTISKKDKLALSSTVVASLDCENGKIKELIPNAGHARYADGVIAFSRPDGTVMAVGYDSERDELTGLPKSVLDGVHTQPLTVTSEFSLSSNGTLAYVPGQAPWTPHTPQWYSLAGESALFTDEAGVFTSARFSPDGRYVAFGIGSPMPDLWLFDLSKDPPTRRRLTRDGRSIVVVWSPDSHSFVYQTMASGTLQMYRWNIEGNQPPQLLLDSRSYNFASSWSSDGKWLAFTEINPDTGLDVWIMSMTQKEPPIPVAVQAFNESLPVFSPDSKWLAYASNETGENEIYIHRFGGGVAKPVTVGGGTEPLWLEDCLLFRREDKLMKMRVTPETEFEFGEPEVVASGLSTTGPPIRLFDWHSQSKRILLTRPESRESDKGFLEIRVISNWIARVKEKLNQN